MRALAHPQILHPVAIHFLAPGAPILEGRLAVVRFRRDHAAPAPPAARWDWDDGVNEEATSDFTTERPSRRVHRYAAPGVYCVRLEMEGSRSDAREPAIAARFVTVRAAGQVGASGWIRDELSGTRIPFGFLMHGGDHGEAGVTFRCLVDGREMEAISLGWLMTDPPASLHFGGGGRMGPGGVPYRYRVDVRAPGVEARTGQHLTLTLYSSRGVPGRDSPILRIAGPIRPGRVDVVVDNPG